MALAGEKLVEGHLAISPPEGVQAWDIDPYAPEIQTDPIPFFTDLRAKGAFAYLPKYSMLICGGYEVTKEVFSDHTCLLYTSPSPRDS